MIRVDVFGIGVVLAAAVVMLALLAVCKRFLPDSEVLRKLAHVSTGGLAMLFPWLFSSIHPVLVVCGLSLLLLFVISSVPSMRTRLGGSLYAVDRASHGEFYFPIAVAMLFGLANGNKLLYLIPLLVLTFADAVAAVLGTIYGKVAYEGAGGRKSLEGSVAFFTVAFFAVHVPLLLYTDLSRPQTLLVALDIALVVTLLEAVAWRGLDNIVIPLGVFLLLHIYTAISVRQLVYRFIAAVILLTAVLLYRSRTTLQASALVASALVLYASWSIGGLAWFLAPAVLFASYSLSLPRSFLQSTRKDTVYAVTSVASAGLLWLFLAKVNSQQHFIFPYFAAYAIHLTILGWTLSVRHNPSRRAWKCGPRLLLQCWVLVFVPYIWIQRGSTAAVEHALLVFPLCAVTFAVFCISEPRHNGVYAVSGWRWVRQAALVVLFTAPLAFLRGL